MSDSATTTPITWRVIPTIYDDSGPLYAIVDDRDQIACDSLDARRCLFTTRATAEYQLSYLRSRDRLVAGRPADSPR